jgi:hypothetical protein
MGKMADGPSSSSSSLSLGKPMGKMADAPLGKPLGKTAASVGGKSGGGGAGAAGVGVVDWVECSGYLPEPSFPGPPRAYWLRPLRVADIGLVLRCDHHHHR